MEIKVLARSLFFVVSLFFGIGIIQAQEFELNTIELEKNFEETSQIACFRSFRDVYKDSYLRVGTKKAELTALTTLSGEVRKRVSIIGTANLHRELSSGELGLRKIDLQVLSDTLYEAKLSDYEENFAVITGLSSMIQNLSSRKLEKTYSCQQVSENQWVFLGNYKIRDWWAGKLRGKPTAISIDDIKSKKMYVRTDDDGRLRVFEYNVPAGYYRRDLTHKSLKYVFHKKRRSIELDLVDYLGTNDEKEGLTHMTVSF